MKLLAVETSTRNFSLAVLSGDKVIRQRNKTVDRILSSAIIPAIKDILSESGLTLQGIDGFAVGLGPGSFTSLRVGLSTVKALAYATGKPIVGIPSLDVLAMNDGTGDTKSICALHDARRGMVYACLYEKKEDVVRKTGDYQLTTVGELLKSIKGKTLFLGDGIRLFRQEIEDYHVRHRSQLTPVFAKEKDWYPHARHLVWLARERFQKGKFDRLDRLVPLYLYEADCQVQR